MNAEPKNVTPRRRRTQPRRLVPATIDQKERRPVAFGWGADLTDRERESLKERIALVAGIVLAVVIAGLLGWGVLYDSVIHPNQVAAENNKPIAIIGTTHPYVVTTGFYKALANFDNTSDTNQIQTYQSQVAQLSAAPKKNAALIAQYQQQIQAYQQNLQNLSQSTLNNILSDETVIQRAPAAGIAITPQVRNAAYTQIMKQMGGPRELASFIAKSGMTRDQVLMLNLGDYIRNTLLQPKLIKAIKPYQTKVRASHILVKSKAEAYKLLKQIQQGANFAALAKKYSTDKSSAVKGGDLGYFAHGAMVAPFDKAAFSMKVGQVRVVQSQFGWHVIKVTGRETVKLTPAEMAQQQQNAVPQWIQNQETILRVQNIVSTNNLPPVPTPNPAVLAPASTGTGTGITGTGAPGTTGKPITVTKPNSTSKSHPVTGPVGKTTTTKKKP